jgi:hypothetical protein
MLFLVGVGILLIAVGIIAWRWVPGGVNAARLGWMSDQWSLNIARRIPCRSFIGLPVADLL